MTRAERDKQTTEIYNLAVKHGCYAPKVRLNGWCRTGKSWTEGIECGEVYSDYWHVKVFDDGTFQVGWLQWLNGTTLVTKNVQTMAEVELFLKNRNER